MSRDENSELIEPNASRRDALQQGSNFDSFEDSD